ncbi:hypothetical protein BPORC_1801 [Bifidobacterium porcinum]|nr:hypothetical protein BPORC_1801 [Bifidobacterium porcinum]
MTRDSATRRNLLPCGAGRLEQLECPRHAETGGNRPRPRTIRRTTYGKRRTLSD